MAVRLHRESRKGGYRKLILYFTCDHPGCNFRTQRVWKHDCEDWFSYWKEYLKAPDRGNKMYLIGYWGVAIQDIESYCSEHQPEPNRCTDSTGVNIDRNNRGEQVVTFSCSYPKCESQFQGLHVPFADFCFEWNEIFKQLEKGGGEATPFRLKPARSTWWTKRYDAKGSGRWKRHKIPMEAIECFCVTEHKQYAEPGAPLLPKPL